MTPTPEVPRNWDQAFMRYWQGADNEIPTDMWADMQPGGALELMSKLIDAIQNALQVRAEPDDGSREIADGEALDAARALLKSLITGRSMTISAALRGPIKAPHSDYPSRAEARVDTKPGLTEPDDIEFVAGLYYGKRTDSKAEETLPEKSALETGPVTHPYPPLPTLAAWCESKGYKDAVYEGFKRTS